MNIWNSKTEKKLAVGIITILMLLIGLCVTTYALIRVSVDRNYFHTGTVQINLNDGKPVIEEHEFLFEPGMTVEKEFFIENQGSDDVYYKIYFDNVMGDLADVLQISILDGEKVLFSGCASSLSRSNTAAADDILAAKERRTLTIRFYFPEDAGNHAQNLTFAFDMCADSVQTKNNPERLFD